MDRINKGNSVICLVALCDCHEVLKSLVSKWRALVDIQHTCVVHFQVPVVRAVKHHCVNWYGRKIMMTKLDNLVVLLPLVPL